MVSFVGEYASGAPGETRIKQEDEDEEDRWQPPVVPTMDVRAVSPGAPLEASTSMTYSYDDGANDSPGNFASRSFGAAVANGRGGRAASTSNGHQLWPRTKIEEIDDTSAPHDSSIANQKTSGLEDEKVGANHTSSCENDIVLSLSCQKYKDKIHACWEKIWGERAKADGPTPKDLAPEVLDDLKSQVHESGGRLYRPSISGDGVHRATDDVALGKIQNDLTRGKQDYKGSRFYRCRSSVKETYAPDSKDEDDDQASDQYFAGSSKSPAPTPTDSDFVVSLLDSNSRCAKMVTKYVKKLLYGQYSRSITSIASRNVKSIRRGGGKLFLLQPGMTHREIDDKEAEDRLRKMMRKKLAEARKNNDQIVVISMKDKKYKGAITNRAKNLEEGHKSSANLTADEASDLLMGEFKRSGVKFFFKNAADEAEASHSEAREKITKDIGEEMRYPCKRGEPSTLSRTRKRKSQGGSTIQYPPREYMWDYVTQCRSELSDYGLTVKKRVINGLDKWVASRTKDGPLELLGWSEILDEVYVCGFFEEHVVGTEEGREFLGKAGIIADPCSIFGEELKIRRKRHKREHDEATSAQGKGGGEAASATSCDDNNGSENDYSMPAEDLNADGSTERIIGGVSCQPDVGGGELAAPETCDPQASKPNGYTPDPQSEGGTRRVSVNAKHGSNDGDPNRTEEPCADILSAAFSGTNPGVATKSTTNCLPRHPCATGRANQVFQIYKNIKTKLSDAKGSKSGTKTSGLGNISKENGEKVLTLQIEFYNHLKNWLAPRVKTVEESSLITIQNLSCQFESAIKELVGLDNDEVDVVGYTGCCECIIDECKETLPLGDSCIFARTATKGGFQGP